MNLFTIKNCVLMILLFFLSNTAIAQFSADMITTNGDITKTSKFYSEKPYYRMDMEEGGQQMFVVVNTETNNTRVFMPSQQMYMEMKSDDIQSTSNDVFQSLEEQKKKYLTQLATGEKIGAFCLTEAQAGSDSFHLKTKADLDGDEWVINGEKLWITNGGIAGILSLFARTEKGISAFIVETDTPGFKAGPAEKKMGIKGSTTNALSFENVRIPKENLLGVDGRGFLIAMKTLDAGRLGLGAACLGVAKELLELSTNYAKERKQFDHPISFFQAVQFMLAEIATMVFNMESIVYRTATDYDLKKDISTKSAMVKLYCSDALDEIADRAVQIHGGMGYSQELSIERFYRDSRINRIFEGTNEIQKGIIARDILKKGGKIF